MSASDKCECAGQVMVEAIIQVLLFVALKGSFLGGVIIITAPLSHVRVDAVPQGVVRFLLSMRHLIRGAFGTQSPQVVVQFGEYFGGRCLELVGPFACAGCFL